MSADLVDGPLTLQQLAELLDAEILTPVPDPQRRVSAGYVSDLLSDVLAHGPAGGVLITVQVHLNVVAVAVHAELQAIVFALGRRPEPPVVERAEEEGVALLVCSQPAFEITGRLYAAGLRGRVG